MSQHRAVGSPWYCAKEEHMGRRSGKGNVSTRGTERRPRAGRAVAKDLGLPDRLETDKQVAPGSPCQGFLGFAEGRGRLGKRLGNSCDQT